MRRNIHKNEFKSIKYLLDNVSSSMFENIKYEIFSSEKSQNNQQHFLKSTIKNEAQLKEILVEYISDNQIIQEIIELFVLDDDFNIPSHLHKQFQNNRVVLFIGAGVSRNAGYPGWWDFAKIAMKRLLKNNMLSNQTYSELIESNTDPKQLLSIFEGVYPKDTEEYRNLY